MYVTRFDPFKELRDLERKFMTSVNDNERGVESAVSSFSPSVNTREDEKEYTIEVDLPGVEKDKISVDLNNNVLTISGERKLKNEDKKDEYYKLESFYGRFSRAFTLPENADQEGIRANAQDGVLEISIPKKTKSDAKKIEIA